MNNDKQGRRPINIFDNLYGATKKLSKAQVDQLNAAEKNADALKKEQEKAQQDNTKK